MKNLHDVSSVGEETERHAQGVPRHSITARPDLIILKILLGWKNKNKIIQSRQLFSFA